VTERLRVYRCNVCGNVVEVLHPGKGKLVCCRQPMELLEEKTVDEGKEKHAPLFEKTDGGVVVKVGAVPHPMEQNHYIEWIEVLADGEAYTRFLNPGDKPEARFELEAKKVVVRAYCNVHGLWKTF